MNELLYSTLLWRIRRGVFFTLVCRGGAQRNLFCRDRQGFAVAVAGLLRLPAGGSVARQISRLQGGLGRYGYIHPSITTRKASHGFRAPALGRPQIEGSACPPPSGKQESGSPIAACRWAWEALTDW